MPRKKTKKKSEKELEGEDLLLISGMIYDRQDIERIMDDWCRSGIIA
ncbi:MAG: hypothetical protein QF673_01870 [Candidatus Hydrothermarchaeota archaeon]|jgi:hypothetical protein|nr:hypothetical protein [Candidatus Hydrothermarchaeota archaeon]MDP6612749.1 hypothetical protein [Candidatus Hydrothermarchaeota archaeon]|tara:strand:- start:518 stop:658 length:141 start_codon:yes stop_codon:yes gene_type:complete